MFIKHSALFFFQKSHSGYFFFLLDGVKKGSSSFKGRFKPKYPKAIGKLDVVRMACFTLLRVYRSF